MHSYSLCWRARQVRVLLRPMFARSASSKPAPVLAARKVRALFWPLFARSSLAQAATVVAGTTGEGAALASFLLFGVVSASHCGGGLDRLGRCSGLCLNYRRWLRQPLWLRARKDRALLLPLFARSALAQLVSVVAATTGEGPALNSVRWVGVGSTSKCCGGHDRRGRCSGLSSLGRLGFKKAVWWRARHVR